QRDLSRSPLFQVLFVLQNIPEVDRGVTRSSVRAGEVAIEQHTAKFELSLIVTENTQGLQTVLEYNTDLFEAATITRWLSHWHTLLEGIVADAEQHLLELPLLTQEERQQVLVEWNATRYAYPDTACLHRLVEE